MSIVVMNAGMSLKNWCAFLIRILMRLNAQTAIRCIPKNAYPPSPPSAQGDRTAQVQPIAEVRVLSAELANWCQVGDLKNETKMNTFKNPKVKIQVNQRLARIEGQLRGVQKMIEDERDCKAILQQLIAIRAAIQAASINFLQEIASECVLNLDNNEDPEAQHALLVDLIQMMGKIT
jgi:CsoR family transcriptional regulator, copper-sensing transcriptional repressor